MRLIDKEHLEKYNVIQDIFDYQFVEEDVYNIYAYFENTFKDLLIGYAEAFDIKAPCFYIKNDCICNAFAMNKKGYNVIGITNGYPILINKKFNMNYFDKIVFTGLINNPQILEAYTDLLLTNNRFELSKFMLDCSIRFTFNHEFQHLLQFKYGNKNATEFVLHENIKHGNFSLRNHILEYDADRMASYEVLKLVFRQHCKLEDRSDNNLIVLLFLGCASIIITKMLFYLGIVNQIEPEFSINRVKFYTEKKSHPHPLVRALNIMEYFFESTKNDFRELYIDEQSMFNNTFCIIKLYFESLVPKGNVIESIFDDLGRNLDIINDYNGKLNECAIKDTAIKSILLARNIKFI